MLVANIFDIFRMLEDDGLDSIERIQALVDFDINYTLNDAYGYSLNDVYDYYNEVWC